MSHYERVMSGRNTASLDAKASDVVIEWLDDFALIGLGQPTLSRQAGERERREMPVHYSPIDSHGLQLEHHR
jgi:hypothetical protein